MLALMKGLLKLPVVIKQPLGVFLYHFFQGSRQSEQSRVLVADQHDPSCDVRLG